MTDFTPIRVIDYDIACSAGLGRSAFRQALVHQQPGLSDNAVPNSNLSTQVGAVNSIDESTVSGSWASWRSRNNALALLGLAQGQLNDSIQAAIKRFGAHRVGALIGSSTASIDRLENAYFELEDNRVPDKFSDRHVINPNSPALFVAAVTGIKGPSLTINNACSSSAKVFASAARWLHTGMVDAVLVGGVDTLCLNVLHGFDSLQLVSPSVCKPFDEHRDGINLGEAGAFALLMRAEDDESSIGIELSGYGESSDAHHMSHPHPEGLGAEMALKAALNTAKLSVHDIDYINLHGTASSANDLIEGQLIERMFASSGAKVSSTKGWTGHTLGAAGIVEAVVAMESITHGFMPACLNHKTPDTRFSIPLLTDTLYQPVQHVMSNSFGFGGNNACLIFSKVGV